MVTVNGLDCMSLTEDLWADRWHVITCQEPMYGKSIKIKTDGAGSLKFSQVEVIHDRAAGTSEQKALATRITRNFRPIVTKDGILGHGVKINS